MKMMIFFLHFHWSFQIFTTLQNPIKYLDVSSLKITKTKQFGPPNLIISLIITFVCTQAHKPIQHPWYSNTLTL
jgi:hypothetical protein